jgi:hypothetical protein
VPPYVRSCNETKRKSSSPPFGYELPDSKKNKPAIATSVFDPTDFNCKSRKKVMETFSRAVEPGSKVRNQIEEARKTGQSSFRHTSKGRIIEVFFQIDLEHLATTSRSSLPTMDEALQEADTYEEIPGDVCYVAYDRNMVQLVCHFPSAFNKVWGDEVGPKIVAQTTRNIDTLTHFVRPPLSFTDPRHCASFANWIQKNASTQPWASGPSARSGVYHFGLWKEQGNPHARAILTKDSNNQTARRGSLVLDLLFWFGNITKTLDIIFEAVDPELHRAYRKAFANIDAGEGDLRSASTIEQELFMLRALLINVLTEPHRDGGDWIKGWAWLTPFGVYQEGFFCVVELRRKFGFVPGNVLGLKGHELGHFTTKWYGSNRYSLVSAFHEAVRKFDLNHS